MTKVTFELMFSNRNNDLLCFNGIFESFKKRMQKYLKFN